MVAFKEGVFRGKLAPLKFLLSRERQFSHGLLKPFKEFFRQALLGCDAVAEVLNRRLELLCHALF